MVKSPSWVVDVDIVVADVVFVDVVVAVDVAVEVSVVVSAVDDVHVVASIVVILVSILRFLIDPGCAADHLSDAQTLTLENSAGWLFSKDMNFSFSTKTLNINLQSKNS